MLWEQHLTLWITTVKKKNTINENGKEKHPTLKASGSNGIHNKIFIQINK